MKDWQMLGRSLWYVLVAAGLWWPQVSWAQTPDDALYRYHPGERSHWSSVENPTGAKGAGGRENRGGKGHAFETVPAGSSLVLADVGGAGIIDRFWITISERSPEMLRAVRLDIYWDGATKPAVSVPIGDFFLAGAGQMVAVDTALFASPEGRSFISYVPMPFRKGARVVLTNESAKQLTLVFFDVDYRTMARQPRDALYFHAYWSRQQATTPSDDFRILPRVSGRGRFLGSAVTVLTSHDYGTSWWGEGAAKIYLDGDRELPSLVGTGTEDLIGTAWQQGAFINRFQGALVSDDVGGRWNFYRFHIPDPIHFDRDAEVSLQQIGGAGKNDVIKYQEAGAALIPITVDPGSRGRFVQLLNGTSPRPITDPMLPNGWTNFYRSDDVSAVAYFYLDRPMSGLSPIAPAAACRRPARPAGTETLVRSDVDAGLDQKGNGADAGPGLLGAGLMNQVHDIGGERIPGYQIRPGSKSHRRTAVI